MVQFLLKLLLTISIDFNSRIFLPVMLRTRSRESEILERSDSGVGVGNFGKSDILPPTPQTCQLSH